MKLSLCVAMVVVWTANSISMAQTPTNKAKKAPPSRATALARISRPYAKRLPRNSNRWRLRASKWTS